MEKHTTITGSATYLDYLSSIAEATRNSTALDNLRLAIGAEPYLNATEKAVLQAQVAGTQRSLKAEIAASKKAEAARERTKPVVQLDNHR